MPSKAKLVTRQSTTSSVSSDNLNKGSELTFAELDSNLINLRDQTIGIVGDDSSGIDVESGDTVKIAGAGGISTAVTGNTVTITQGAVTSTGDLEVVDELDVHPSVTGQGIITAVGVENTALVNIDRYNGTYSSPTALGNTTSVGDIVFRSHDGSSLDSIASIEVNTKGSQDGGEIIFNTASAGSLTERMRIDNSALVEVTGNLTASGTVTGNILATEGLSLQDNQISGSRSNDNIRIIPSGTGIVDVNSTVNVAGNLVATGNVENDAIRISDNNILGIRSNEDLLIDANGTGILQVGSGTDGTSAASSNVGVLQVYENLADTPGTREYALGRTMMIKTDGSDSSSGNVRYRIQDTIQLDLNDSALTSSSTTRGPQMQHLVEIKDTSSSGTSTAGAITGQGTGIFFPGSGSSGSTINVTNAFSIRSFGLSTIASGETVNVTDYYHFYADAFNDAGSGTTSVTNEYAFYDNGNKLSRFGAVILANQSSDPSTLADSAHIFAKDDSGVSHVYAQDEAGNQQKLASHNLDNEWEYYSKNIKTGKVTRINMEKMIRDIEKLTGKTYIETE